MRKGVIGRSKKGDDGAKKKSKGLRKDSTGGGGKKVLQRWGERGRGEVKEGGGGEFLRALSREGEEAFKEPPLKAMTWDSDGVILLGGVFQEGPTLGKR